MSDHSGKVVLITGAARGLGAAAARAYAEAGATVIASDVLAEEGRRIANDVGAQFFSHDVSDEGQWSSIVAQILSTHGTIDVLINNAGMLHSAPLKDTRSEDWHRLVAVNQTGPFLGMRAVAPAMIRQDGGNIINVSSVAVTDCVPGTIAYTATKSALVGMTKVAAKELGPHGIRVNALLPGMMDTPMVEALDPDGTRRAELVKNVPLRRTCGPVEMAQTLLWLTSDAAAFVTGALMQVDGGASA